MDRRLRSDLATALGAIPLASIVAQIWLRCCYYASRPPTPRADLGFTYALDDRGAHAYISAEEATGLALVLMAFLIGLALVIVVVPKTFIYPPRKMPRGLPQPVTPGCDLHWSQPRSRFMAIFFGALAFWLATMAFAGPLLAHLLVSHGIVLRIG